MVLPKASPLDLCFVFVPGQAFQFEIKMILFGTLAIFINEGDLDLKYCIQCTAATCRLLNQENKAKERVRITERHLANTTSSSTTTLCDGKVTGLMVVSAMSSNI